MFRRSGRIERATLAVVVAVGRAGGLDRRAGVGYLEVMPLSDWPLGRLKQAVVSAVVAQLATTAVLGILLVLLSVSLHELKARVTALERQHATETAVTCVWDSGLHGYRCSDSRGRLVARSP